MYRSARLGVFADVARNDIFINYSKSTLHHIIIVYNISGDTLDGKRFYLYNIFIEVR